MSSRARRGVFSSKCSVFRKKVVTYPTNAAVGFDGRIHRFAGNIAMGDGSVQQVTSSRLAEQFQEAALTMTNTLIVP